MRGILMQTRSKNHGDIFAARLNVSDLAAQNQAEENAFYDWLNQFRPTYILNIALFNAYLAATGSSGAAKHVSSDYDNLESSSEWGEI